MIILILIFFPGYKSIIKNNYRDGLGGAGGVAIVYKNNMKIKRIMDRKDRVGFDSIELEMELERKFRCRLLVVYRRPGKIERAGTWKDLVKNMDKNCDRIVVGDFNVHNVAWNCEETDRNEDRLMDKFEDKDLFIINRDTKSRMGVLGQKDFNINSIFASKGVLNYLEYYQEKDSWDSDHFPIGFKLRVKYGIYKKKTNRLSSKKTDWKIYTELLMEKDYIFDVFEFKEMDEEEKYNMIIVKCMKESVLVASGKSREALNENLDGKGERKVRH